MPPNVVFCITCKDRTRHLEETLGENLAWNRRSKFIVVNYNSQDDLLEVLRDQYSQEINAGRLVVYTYRDWPKFRMAHAKNMAHRLGILEGGDLLVNLDADNLTGEGFEEFIQQKFATRRDIFLWANMIKGQMTRGISGRMVLTKESFTKLGGYNEEKFAHWGSDDKELNLRLKLLDYEGIEIPAEYLLAIPHNDKVRFKDYPEIGKKCDSYFEVHSASIGTTAVNGNNYGCGVVWRNFDFINPIQLSPLPNRIFGIGLHKTATTSLHHAFKILGFDSWHWSSAHTAKAIWREMNNQGYSTILERYYCLCDLPIPLLYEKLDKAYPGSKFILTIRKEWLNSIRKHWDFNFNRFRSAWATDPFTNQIHKVLYGQEHFDEKVFTQRYEAHNYNVLDYFKHRPNDLLVLEPNGDDTWSKLCKFLNLPVPSVSYPTSYVSPRRAKMQRIRITLPGNYTGKQHWLESKAKEANRGLDYPTELFGTADQMTISYDPQLGKNGKLLAKQLLYRLPPQIKKCQSIFGASIPAFQVVIAPLSGLNDGSGGAYHYGCDFTSGNVLYIDAAFNNPQLDVGLTIAELVECQMGQQAKGWNCGGSNGEALSRFLAELASGGPNGALASFSSALAWDVGGRPNWLNTTEDTDQNPISIGCGMVYLYWMLSLGFSPTQITQAAGATLADNWGVLTNKPYYVAWPTFIADVNAKFLSGTIASDDPWG